MRIRVPVVLVTAAVTGLLLATGAEAATFEVTRTDDPAAASCNPADCSLRAAVNAANFTADHDRIELGPQTYALGLVGTGEQLGATGDLDVTGNGKLEIVGAGSALTTIDAGGIDRILDLADDVELELTGLTLTGGDPRATADLADREGGAVEMPEEAILTATDVVLTGNDALRGGAIRAGDSAGPNDDPIVRLIDSAVAGNEADGEGGGIAIGNRGQLTALRSALAGNTAGTRGGAVYLDSEARLMAMESSIDGNVAGSNGGAIYSNGFAKSSIVDSSAEGNEGTAGGFLYSNNDSGAAVVNSDFSDNEATGTNGGTFFVQNESQMTFVDGSVTDSQADNNGGAFFIQNDSQALILRSQIRGSSAAEGGGLFIQNDGDVTIRDSAVTGNLADDPLDGGGGGLMVRNNALVTLSRSLLAGNSAPGTTGGGISVEAASNVELGLESTTLSGNSADAGGGINAASNSPTGLRLLVESSTITANAAAAGAGINQPDSPDGRIRVARSIISANSGPQCSGPAALESLGYNLAPPGCGFAEPSDQGGSPQLGPLAANGGPTRTHALLAGSPAIDAAGTTCAEAPSPQPTDQRGVARPDGPACDLGAFELEQSFGANARVRLNRVTLRGNARRVVAVVRNKNAFPVKARVVFRSLRPRAGRLGASTVRIPAEGRARPRIVLSGRKLRQVRRAGGIKRGRLIARLTDPNGGKATARRGFRAGA